MNAPGQQDSVQATAPSQAFNQQQHSTGGSMYSLRNSSTNLLDRSSRTSNPYIPAFAQTIPALMPYSFDATAMNQPQHPRIANYAHHPPYPVLSGHSRTMPNQSSSNGTTYPATTAANKTFETPHRSSSSPFYNPAKNLMSFDANIHEQRQNMHIESGKVPASSFGPSVSIRQASQTGSSVPSGQEPAPSISVSLRSDASIDIYDSILQRTNTWIVQGNLVQGHGSLLQLSAWLINNVERSDLHQDKPIDPRKTQNRLIFWRHFNHSWLALLQRQVDESSRTAQTNSILTEEHLEKLGDEAVRLGDALEKYGLVDYQMGFCEEEVITMIKKCIDLLNND